MPFSLECSAGNRHSYLGNQEQWVSEMPPSLPAASPLGCKITVPWSSRGYDTAWLRLLGSHTAVARWQGAVQSGTTRSVDMLTTAWSRKMRASACVWWARMGGGKEEVLGTVPSGAVDENVGRFKGRHFANSEAVGLIPPTPLSLFFFFSFSA